MPNTDLQKKDELRRELRVLNIIHDEFKQTASEGSIAFRLLVERIEDIKKALED